MIRMYAIPLASVSDEKQKGPPKNAAGKSMFALLRAWATGMGEKWEDVIWSAGIRDKGRSTKNRMDKGTAAWETAMDIAAELKKRQDESGKEVDVGPQVLQLREWLELGGRLALADPARFAEIFERVRKVVEGAESSDFERAAK